MTLMMMGTASEIAAAPTEAVTFLEDLSDDQLVSATKLSPGLGNFGNTCYLNSTVQVLHKIPDLKQALANAGVRTGPTLFAPRPRAADPYLPRPRRWVVCRPLCRPPAQAVCSGLILALRLLSGCLAVLHVGAMPFAVCYSSPNQAAGKLSGGGMGAVTNGALYVGVSVVDACTGRP